MKPTIIKDTREQQGWNFSKTIWCQAMEVSTLKTGDYAIKGYEDYICIERKKTPEELSINLGKAFKQFDAELQRMQSIKYRFVVCEFSFWDLYNFPKFTKIPKYSAAQIRMNGPFMLKRITELEIKYGVHFVFCENVEGAFLMASNLIKRVWESEIDKQGD